MLKLSNRGTAIVFATVFIITTILIGCKKEDSFQTKTTDLGNQLSTSSEFRLMFLNLSHIKAAIRNSSNSIQEKIIKQDLFKEAASITNEHSLNSFLLKLGYKNTDEIVKLTTINNTLVSGVFIKFPELYKLGKDEILLIFNDAKTLMINVNPNLTRTFFADVCSTQYAAGMGGCSDALAWDLVAAGVGGILALGGSPFASAGTVLVMSGIAYAQEYHCKVGVVNTWRECRLDHPVH